MKYEECSLYQFHQFTLPLHALYLNNYLGHETTYNAHVPLLPLPFIYLAYSAINTLLYYVYNVPVNFQLVTSTQYFQFMLLFQ